MSSLIYSIYPTFSSDEYYTEQNLGSGFTDNNVTVTEAIDELEEIISKKDETIAAALNDLNIRLTENSSTVNSNIEELEETLTAAVTDINTRMVENTALATLAEQVRLLTERVKALEDAAQTT